MGRNRRHKTVNPVRNSSGALDPAGIILRSNPAAEQRGIISNGVNEKPPCLRAEPPHLGVKARSTDTLREGLRTLQGLISHIEKSGV